MSHASRPQPLDPEEVARLSSGVRDLAAGLLRDKAAAEDVAQDAWMAALEGRRPADVPLRWWIRGVVRNVARRFVRSESTRGRHERAQPPERASEDPADTVARGEMYRRLAALATALEEPYRSAVWLRYFEGLTPKEIAARTGAPASTVRVRVKRGLAQLRARLDAEHDGDRAAWALSLLPVAAGFPTTDVVREPPVATVGPAGLLAAVAVALLVLAFAGAFWWTSGWAGSEPTSASASDVGSSGSADDPSGRGAAHRQRTATSRGRRSSAASDAGRDTTSASAATQGSGTAAPEPPFDPELRVTVVDAGGRRAVSGARARLFPLRVATTEYGPPPVLAGSESGGAALDEAHTGEDGICVLVRPSSASYRVLVEAGDRRTGSSVVLAQSRGARVALRNPVPFAVEARDALDRPIPGAEVRVAPGPGFRDVVLLGRTNTDGRLDAVGPLRRRVIVRADGLACVETESIEQGKTLVARLAPAAAVAGQVLGPDGRPAAGARVTGGWDDAAVVTGADGRFRISDLRIDDWPDEMLLHARLEGVGEAWVSTRPGDEQVILRLLPGRTVRGRVLLPGGAPAAGASFRAWDPAGERVNGEAAADGSFEFPIKGSGTFEVRFSHGTLADVAELPESLGKAPLRQVLVSGDATGTADPAPLEVVLDDQPLSFHVVRVQDASGRPVPSARVVLGHGPRSRSVPLHGSKTDANGVSVRPVRAPAGFSIRVVATRAGTGDLRARSLEKEFRTTAAPNRVSGVLTVHPRCRVTLDLRGEEGDALPHDVDVLVRPQRMGVEVDPEHPRTVLAPVGETAVIEVRATGFGDVRRTFDVPLAAAHAVTVRLARAAGVRGRLLDPEGRALPLASVGLRPPGRTDWTRIWTLQERLGPGGDFVLDGVDPGPWRLVAFRRDEALELDLLLRLEPGKIVDVGDVRLCGIEWLAGWVRDDRGRGLGGVGVRVRTADEPFDALTPDTVTTADGRFRMAVPRTVRGVLELVKRGFGTEVTPITGHGAEQVADLRLRRGARLRVRVTVPDGERLGYPQIRIRRVSGVPYDPPWEYTDETPSSPEFVVADVPSGDLVVTVRSDDFRATIPLRTVAGEEARAAVRAQRVAGRSE